MRDLQVIAADADMQAVMQAVLHRHQALGIRPVDYEVRRHDGRDLGLYQDGPEATRSLKGNFQHLLLLWDFHGSGQEHKATPESSAANLQLRLDAISWQGVSAAVAIAPELEEWLWYNTAAIGKWLGHADESQLNPWLAEFSTQQEKPVELAKQELPKELFEFVCRRRWKRQPRVQDYAQIAKDASLAAWHSSATFKAVTEQLRVWFPPPPPV